MKKQLQQHLEELRAEYAARQKALSKLVTKQIALKNILIQTKGAIQVLNWNYHRKALKKRIE